jgi:ketohexokinase
LAESLESTVILEDLAHYGVNFDYCSRHPGHPPASSVMLNPSEGSRTIVHYRDLPEFAFEDFAQIDLGELDWVHFEGRNVPELKRMLHHVRAAAPELPVSLEAEKLREGIEDVLPLADLLLCSRNFASSHGFDNPWPFLAWLRDRAPQAGLVVGWGDQGAFALDRSGAECSAPTWAPGPVQDTLGAGDTFNAGMIDAFIQGAGMQEALGFACKLAGLKCGVSGFDLGNRIEWLDDDMDEAETDR